jgi:DNA-binding HxlR family transcriptional regulator
MMDPEPKDVIVLGAIRRGEKKFDKIQRITQVNPEELNSILEKLEERGFIQVEEKKGWFGKKIELTVTEKGSTELDERIHEIQERWGNMSQIYKTGDKQKLQECMEENKSFLPMMMFFGVMDMMMFSMMFSMMGMAMTDYVPTDSIPEDSGMDGGDLGMDGDGFDFDIGF